MGYLAGGASGQAVGLESPRVGSIPAPPACLQVRWASPVCGVGAGGQGVGLISRWCPPAWVRFPLPLLGGLGKHPACRNCLRVDSLKIDSIKRNHHFLSHFSIQKPYQNQTFQQSVGYSAIRLKKFFSLRSHFILRDAAAALRAAALRRAGEP